FPSSSSFCGRLNCGPHSTNAVRKTSADGATRFHDDAPQFSEESQHVTARKYFFVEADFLSKNKGSKNDCGTPAGFQGVLTLEREPKSGFLARRDWKSIPNPGFGSPEIGRDARLRTSGVPRSEIDPHSGLWKSRDRNGRETRDFWGAESGNQSAPRTLE